MRGLEQAKYQAKRSLRSRLGEKETLNPAIIAKVGNGAGTVVVSGRPGWIHVRLHGDDNQLTEAKLGIPFDTASLNDAWVRIRRASARKASYYVVEEFITSSTGSSTPPMSAHPLDPDDGPHIGTLSEDDVTFSDTGHGHTGGADGKKLSGAVIGGDIDAAQYQIQWALFHKGTSFPTDPAPVQGQPFYRTDEDKLYIYDGAVWQEIGAGGGAPTDASYVTTEAEGGLSNEKVLGNDVIMCGPAASKPAAATPGRIYIETDGSHIVWRDNGSSWDEIARGEAGIRLAQLAEKAHTSLTGVAADQHHAQVHDSADHAAAPTPAQIDIGDGAVTGTGAPARGDHQHPFPAPPAGYPVTVAATEADGTATTPARADHRHAHGSGYLPNAHHAASVSKQASASAQLILTTTPQNVPNCSLSLEAGTWLVIGVFYNWCADFGTGTSIIGLLDVGGVDETALCIWRPSAASTGATSTQVWRITLESTTTLKLQAYKLDDTGNYRILGDQHTNITAIRTSD